MATALGRRWRDRHQQDREERDCKHPPHNITSNH
jgi:hypothetical protein